MKIPFTKMQGIANDYIYVNCMERELPDPAEISRQMSPRHFSVGADGLVLICPSTVADAKMRIFNADGSEAQMCGNATRCVGKYLYDNGICKKNPLTLETLSGIKILELFTEKDQVTRVRVDMGIASTKPESLPVLFDGERMVNEALEVDGTVYYMTAVSMGNPHAVTFLPRVDDLPLEKMGPKFENHPLFPQRVNTEFVRVIDPHTLEMRVWERGSGETFACGTGACATVAAAVLNGICPPDESVTVKLLGGDLEILCTKDMRLFMTGAATKVYDGVYEYEHSDQ